MVVNTRSQFLESVKKRIADNPACLEIGVEKGIFSEMIMCSLSPGKLFLVDPWETGADKNGKEAAYSTGLPTAYSSEDQLRDIEARFGSEIREGRVEIIRGYSYDALDSFADKSLDFIYIDACHLYDSVLWDLESYLPKLKDGGIISGHDYVDYPFFGVIAAVNDFCSKHGYEISIFNTDGGDWALSPIRQQ
jgi:hypothetical protein